MLFHNREKFAGEKIPTLEEAVEECLRLQLTIYFDVKGHPDEVLPADDKLLRKEQPRAEIERLHLISNLMTCCCGLFESSTSTHTFLTCEGGLIISVSQLMEIILMLSSS